MGLGWIFGMGLILGRFRWVLPWWCLVVVEVVIDGGGGFDECRCGWVFFGVANRLWLLVVVGKREKEREK